MKNLNWVGIVAALVVGQVIGIVWYGTLFSAAWMTAHGWSTDMAGGESWKMALGAVNMLVVLIGLAMMIARRGVTDFMGGAKVGLFVALFFAFTVVTLNYIYAMGSPTLLWIDGGYQFLTLAVGGALIAGLRFGRKAP